MQYNIEFTWPDYKKFSGTADSSDIESAVRKLLFRGLLKTRSRPYIALKAKEIIEAGAYKNLDEFPMPKKNVPLDKPLPPLNEEGDVVGSMKKCLSAIREALAGNQTEQEIASEQTGLPVDRELAIPYNQGKAKPDGDDRHPHFYKDVFELQDPFQY
jgi:hypothetical protein